MLIDARLYLAMSLAKMGKTLESVAQQAYDLNTTDQVAFKYLVMSKLAEWDKKIQADHSMKALVDEIESLLKANRILLSNNDPWLLALTSILDKAATRV